MIFGLPAWQTEHKKPLSKVTSRQPTPEMSSRKHFAILVGIDFYPEKPLKSCVGDANLVEKYLKATKDRGDFQELEIVKLTASNPVEPGNAKSPEDPSSLPTLENLRRSLSRVTAEAGEGDHVYIHFSGHGTITPSRKLALGFLADTDGRYTCLELQSSVLTQIIDGMVQKGVKILLVLDCCFSGRVSRHGEVDNSRYLEYQASWDTGSEKTLGSSSSTSSTTTTSPTQDVSPTEGNFRDASTSLNWTLDTKSYTILTACGPAEESYSLNVGGQAYGALTYFLVRTLRKMEGLKMSHFAIFQFICAMFRGLDRPQTPQLKGSGDLTFFGYLRSSDDAFFPIVSLPNGQLVLDAGEILGICEGEALALCPLSAMAAENWDGKYEIAYAQNVGGVLSKLRTEEKRYYSARIDATWVARPLRLVESSLSYRDAGRPPSLGIEGEATAGRGLELFPPGTPPASAPFRAIVNSHGQFEIRDKSDLKVDFYSVSLLSPESASAHGHILDVLAYLCRFHEIANVKPAKIDKGLAEAIDIQICKPREQPDPDSKTEPTSIEMRDGETLVMSIRNRGQHPVYVNIFCLTWNWEIRNLLNAENTVISPGSREGTQECTLELGVIMRFPESPELKDRRSCTDIIKVFITTHSAPFANMGQNMQTFRTGLTNLESDIVDHWISRTFHICTSKNLP